MNYINFHFKELKFSIIYSFISISSLIIVVYDYIEIFLSYYISFTGTNIHFIFTDLMEVFFINIQFSILFACIFSFPSIMLLVLLYVKPGLYTYENNLINRLYFIYNFLVLPSIIYWIPHLTLYLISYFNDLSYNQWNYYEVELLQRFNNFYNLIFYLNLISVLFTLIPLIIILVILPKRYAFISSISNLSLELKRVEKKPGPITIWRKYIYLASLLGIAVITPPDILSLIIIFLPLFVVYEFITYLICILNNLRDIKFS